MSRFGSKDAGLPSYFEIFLHIAICKSVAVTLPFEEEGISPSAVSLGIHSNLFKPGVRDELTHLYLASELFDVAFIHNVEMFAAARNCTHRAQEDAS